MTQPATGRFLGMFQRANGAPLIPKTVTLTLPSVLYNASVAVYNPSSNTFEKGINFPPLTMDPIFHASGIDVDHTAKRLSVIVEAGVAFDTEGANVTGDNFLYKVDLNDAKREVLWRANLTAVTDGAYGGCQDAAHDGLGNTFVVCTYPSAVIKVNADGSAAVPWYLSNYKTPGASVTQAGLSGIVSTGDLLLAADARDKNLVRFDISAEKGKPVVIPVTGMNLSTWNSLDGVFMPPKYGGKVLLISSNTQGTNVLVSRDGWQSAQQIGFVAKPTDQDTFAVATLQIRDRIYGINEYFLDAANKPKVDGTNAGPRKQFPLQNLTKKIDELVKNVI